MKAIVIILFHICLLPKIVWAQEKTKLDRNLIWVRIGAGIVDLNAAGNLGLNYQRKQILYSLQAVHSFYQTNPQQGSVYEYSSFVGLASRGNYNRLSVSGGISLCSFTSYKRVNPQQWEILPQYEVDEINWQFSFPLLFQVSAPLNNGCALSCALQASYGKRSFYSATLGINFGKKLYNDK